MNTEDRVFFRTFLVVLAVLVAIAIIIYTVASGMISSKEQAQGIDPRTAAVITERIKPEGNVAIGEPPKDDAPAVVANAAPRSGEELVNTVCSGCHASGALDAPKLGDNPVWAGLVAQKGVDGLIKGAIVGAGNMPPRGGDGSASDAEINAAVKFMLKQAGL